MHGYALAVKFTFGANTQDDRNWVQDFGGLKELKAWLKEMFDHTYLVAKDDPELEVFKYLEDKELVDLRVVDSTGCERFSEMVFMKAQEIVEKNYGDRCWVESVTVREHESNSATCRRV